MNKILSKLLISLGTLVAVTLLGVPQAQAQTELSRLRTSEYVAKDINGKEHNIDAILKSGKAILIDFSATWCGPCWSVHKLGILERVHEMFGPNGTNQIEILWVEASSEPIEAIYGDASKYKDGPTRGNWTKDPNGKPVPYPLISDSQLAAKIFGFSIFSFPTFVLIGPDKKWTNCDEAIYDYDDQARMIFDHDFKKLKQMLTLFLTKDDKPEEVEFSGMTEIYLGETTTLDLHYTSVAPVTSIAYDAPEGISVTKISDTQYKVSAQRVGTYEITATVTNKNGSAKGRVTLTVSEPISTFPIFSPMDNKEKMDKGWRSVDHDGDGFAFDSALGRGFYERVGFIPEETYNAGAENSKDCLISWGNFFPVTMDEGGRVQGYEISPQNELRSAPMKIDANASKPTFSCYISHFLGDDKPDQLKVMISEPGGTPVELLAPQTSTEDWKQIKADLSAYKGKTIYLSLIPVVNGSSGIAVDQLRVTMDGSTDVETPTLTLQTSLYPNPATDYITVRTVEGSVIELFASDGTVVATAQATSAETTMTLSQLPAGRYLARITAPDGETILRPVIIR